MFPDLQLRHLLGGPLSMFFSVDGGRSRISSSDASQGGPPLMFFNVDGGRSWFYSSGTSQEARH
jgi:hypothetical protein